jgi:gliding motility-associated-like protein
MQVNDSTFIFTFFVPYQNQPQIKSSSTDGLPAHFEWYKFDESTQTVNLVQTDSSELQSIVDVQPGGYMLRRSNAAEADTFRAWVFYDKIVLNNIIVADNNCDFLKLEVEAEQEYRTNPNYFDYFDFCDLNAIQTKFIRNNFTITWEASADISAGGRYTNDAWKSSRDMYFTRIDPAPLADAEYSAEMTDVFGYRSNKITSATVPCLASYADFDVLVRDENGIFTPTTTFRGEALYRIKLNNKSINADKFRWIGMFNQEINIQKNDTLWIYNTENIADEIHYTPGIWPVSLAVENTSTGCRSMARPRDAAGKEYDLTVEHSLLESSSIPNVFSPNGDGMNDVFKFIVGNEPTSMRNINIKIYGRNGNLVYKYAGEAALWEGWNGRYLGNKAECASGIYHYVVSGDGWDGKQYAGKQFTGTVHLFRGQ